MVYIFRIKEPEESGEWVARFIKTVRVAQKYSTHAGYCLTPANFSVLIFVQIF